MKRKTLFFIFLISILLISMPPAFAQDHLLTDAFEISADYAFYTKYVWRGFVLDEDAVLQPGFYMSYKGLSMSVWSSMDTDNNEGANSDEIDFTVDYTFSIQKLGINVGHIYYDFPGINGYTKEYYIGLSYDGLLSPSLTWNHDYLDAERGGGDGDYYVFALSHSFALKKGYIFDLSGHVGHNKGHFIKGTGGDIAIAAGLNIPLTKTLTMTPTFYYSYPYGDLKEQNDGDQDKKAYGGIIIGYSF